MKRGNKNIPRCSCVKGCNLCCTFSVPSERGAGWGATSLLDSVSWHKSLCGNSHLCVHAFRAKPTKTSTGTLDICGEVWWALWAAGNSCRLSPLSRVNIQTRVPRLAGHFQDCECCHTLPKLSTWVINLLAVSGYECGTIGIDTQSSNEWGIDLSLNQTATKH